MKISFQTKGVFFVNIWRKIRRWLKQRRRMIALGCTMLAVLVAVWGGQLISSSITPADDDLWSIAQKDGFESAAQSEVPSSRESLPERSSEAERSSDAAPAMAAEPVTLLVETKYLCGTETEFKQFEDIQTVQQWLTSAGADTTVKEQSDHTVVVVREVLDDLAPICKEEGYFGLSEEGILTLYQGPPHEKRVIETFYRIDTRKLESMKTPSQEEGLQEGIRIQDVADYWDVLSRYGQYAADGSTELE
jgi:forespore regulator of the sigma-K checkpoint